MNNLDANELVTLVVERIKQEYSLDPHMFSDSSLALKSELVVRDAIYTLMDTGDIPKGDIVYSEKSHQFPDIVLKLESGFSLGIEVKSSSSANNSWSINGNSVLGSTSVAVDDMYIVFIKYNAKNGFDIKHARYQDSIADVVVTHSPRYKIDLNIDSAKTFFHRSGIDYQDIQNSDNPISLITDYFRKEGKTAWWLGDDSDEKSSSATILSWRDFDKSEQKKILGQAFVLFPELLSRKRVDKYFRLAQWLVAKYSIVSSSLRDSFTAGGRASITYKQSVLYSAPRMYQTLFDKQKDVKVAFSELDINELQEFWTSYHPTEDNIEARKKHWYQLISTHEDEIHLLNFIALLFEIDVP